MADNLLPNGTLATTSGINPQQRDTPASPEPLQSPGPLDDTIRFIRETIDAYADEIKIEKRK